MRTISVITTVEPALSTWLPQAAASVHAATSWLGKHGVDLEWVLVVDGPGALPKFRTAENVILRRTATRVGPAAGKNLAAVGAHGEWLVDLPADAELYAGSLHELLLHPGMGQVAWACTGARGDRTPARPTARGTLLLPPGSLATQWSSTLPFNPEHLLVRKDAVLGCGGWPAVPALENLALLVRLDRTETGAAVPHTVFTTRDWDGSRHRAAGWEETVTDARWAIANLLPTIPPRP